MTDTQRPAAFFLADDRALDFLNSVASPWGSEMEWLGNGHDLLNWLEHAELAPVSVLTKFREEAGLEDLDAIAAQVRELREWFRDFVGTHAGRPLPSSALGGLDAINHLLAQDNTYRLIEAQNLSDQDRNIEGTSLHLTNNRRWQSLETLLLPIAEAIGEFVCNANFELVKNCEGPSCTLWFHDVSLNHARRWCSMSVCGNRAKAAAYRARKRSAPTLQK